MSLPLILHLAFLFYIAVLLYFFLDYLFFQLLNRNLTSESADEMYKSLRIMEIKRFKDCYKT